MFTKDNIKKVSIIGAGQIGPDIALHFSKTLASIGVSVVIIDISLTALEKAKEKIFKKIQKATDTGAFKPELALKMKDSIVFSDNYDLIKGSELIVEAATEDSTIKDKIFKQVESITEDKCIYLSNSSHLQPEVIFKNIHHKRRCMVAHYFFPAEINPVVEIVPANDTDPLLTESLLKFYESIGKVPIKVNSSYGYAIDPIFEGLCQTAILCLEKGMGNEKEIDFAACKALGLGVGPFTALNLTGGNPITAHGLDEMGKFLMPWFNTPETLKVKTQQKGTWNTAQRGEKVEISSEKEQALVHEFLGAYFALSSYILDLNICSINDLNMACELSLVIKPPFTFMNKTGLTKALSYVKDFCKNHPLFSISKKLEKACQDGEWKLSDVVTSVKENVLIITIRRPKVLNALNLVVLKEIRMVLENSLNNSDIKGIVITGFGTKAFVSGADINMLANLKTSEDGYHNSKTFQSILNYIENYPKPVVCAMNGFAFGGGNELALACATRICKKGLPVLVCQPEVNLGFIPGAGGTQRLPRIIGIDKAAEILRTARNVSSREAVEIGLVFKEAENDLCEEAVLLARQISEGKVKIKFLSKEPISSNGNPKDMDLGHLSKKIDELLVRCIYEGARMSLPEGLDFESQMFGECLNTEDMRIGLDNFKVNGPKVKAKFIHR